MKQKQKPALIKWQMVRCRLGRIVMILHRAVNEMGQVHVLCETAGGCVGSHVHRKEVKDYFLCTNVLSWYMAEFFRRQASLKSYASHPWGGYHDVIWKTGFAPTVRLLTAGKNDFSSVCTHMHIYIIIIIIYSASYTYVYTYACTCTCIYI